MRQKCASEERAKAERVADHECGGGEQGRKGAYESECLAAMGEVAQTSACASYPNFSGRRIDYDGVVSVGERLEGVVPNWTG